MRTRSALGDGKKSRAHHNSGSTSPYFFCGFSLYGLHTVTETLVLVLLVSHPQLMLANTLQACTDETCHAWYILHRCQRTHSLPNTEGIQKCRLVPRYKPLETCKTYTGRTLN